MRNQQSNLFEIIHFCDFLPSVFFCCLFSKLVKYLISSATFVRYTLGFIFVFSLIDLLGLDSMLLM